MAVGIFRNRGKINSVMNLVRSSILLLSFFVVACVAAPQHQQHQAQQHKTYRPVSYMPQMGKADMVLVKKSESKLYLMRKGRPIKSYKVAFGANPIGHKLQEGDHKTPEGRYILDYKNQQSKFYKSINISYPNEQDIAEARARGVDPGDDIVIHGYPNELYGYTGPIYPQNWTQGCIGVKNHEMDEIWAMVEVDTPIEIHP